MMFLNIKEITFSSITLEDGIIRVESCEQVVFKNMIVTSTYNS
jgi:hypothetical protein